MSSYAEKGLEVKVSAAWPGSKESQQHPRCYQHEHRTAVEVIIPHYISHVRLHLKHSIQFSQMQDGC